MLAERLIEKYDSVNTHLDARTMLMAEAGRRAEQTSEDSELGSSNPFSKPRSKWSYLIMYSIVYIYFYHYCASHHKECHLTSLVSCCRYGDTGCRNCRIVTHRLCRSGEINGRYLKILSDAAHVPSTLGVGSRDIFDSTGCCLET